MFHFFEAIQNTSGDALPGYLVKVFDSSTGAIVPIYSDNSGTPIVNSSGIDDTAVVDDNGNVSLYVAHGTYSLGIYSPSGVQKELIPDYPLGSSTVTLASGAAVATRALLAGIDSPAALQVASLSEAGREGTFIFDDSDLSAEVTADTAQGIYVAPSTDTTGASGAWVRKFEGPLEVDWFGPDGVNDTTAIHAACALGLTIGKPHVRVSSDLICTTAIVFDEANLHVEGNGATITNSLDGKAFSFEGSGLNVHGLKFHQSATGADPAPYAELSGANNDIHDNIFTRSAGAHIPFYVRSTATGSRFRNNRCTWYGGMNLISNVKNFEISGNSFINTDSAASDDGIAIKAIAGIAENILIADNYFENMADFVGIGSEIGALAATDSTYSNIARGITIVGNRGKNCTCMVFIKPGAVDGVDYRDGTVRGITISDNLLIDASGTNMIHGVRIAAGRGARVFDVTGRNNRCIGRTKTGGSNSAGLYIYIRNDGTGTADCVIDKIDVAIEVIDPYDGAASGGSAPGSPWPAFVNMEKANTANGTGSGIILDVIGNGCLNSALRIQGGFDNGVTVRRALLTNIVVANSTNFAGIHTDSIIKVGSEISMTVAAGSSGLQYKLVGTGSVTPLYPQQIPAYSVVGNSTSAAATGTAVASPARALAQGGAAVALTGTTTETVLATASMAAAEMGANGKIRVLADFSYTNSANVKTLRVRLGGLAGTTLWSGTPTTTAGLQVELELRNRNAAASQRWSAKHILSSAGVGVSTGTATVNTANAQDIVITGQLANSGETITLEGYDVTLAAKA